MTYVIFSLLILVGLTISYLLVKFLRKATEMVMSHETKDKAEMRRLLSSISFWIILLLFTVYVNMLIIFMLEIPKQNLDIISKVFISLYVFVGSIILGKIVSSIVFPTIAERVRKITGTTDISFSVTIMSNIIGLVFVVIGIGVLLALWNISLIPLITTLGIGGLAVAIALQDTLANFFAGIQVLLVHQVRVGDYVKLEGGDEGFVVDVNWRNTTVRDLFNNIIIIPNSKLISSIVKNFYLPDQSMSILVPVEVSIENDLKFVEDITLKVAKEVQQTVEGADRNWIPLIRYTSFTDYSVKFNVVLRVVEYTYQFPLKHEFLKKLHSVYKSERIRFSVPMLNIKN
ncbi:MAG: mechanosensitive ion channel family protein [Brevinematales bacterium]|nr:mechanosensitive ion channel family protein [Brevinematales bacterium]